jgi:hypothetical protein
MWISFTKHKDLILTILNESIKYGGRVDLFLIFNILQKPKDHDYQFNGNIIIYFDSNISINNFISHLHTQPGIQLNVITKKSSDVIEVMVQKDQVDILNLIFKLEKSTIRFPFPELSLMVDKDGKAYSLIKGINGEQLFLNLFSRKLNIKNDDLSFWMMNHFG